MAFGPRGAPHGFQNVGDTPGRLLVIATPSGVERLFEQCAELLPGPLDTEALAAFVAILATLRDGKGTSTKTLGGCSQAWSLERLGNRERRADSLRPVGFRNGGERLHIQSAK